MWLLAEALYRYKGTVAQQNLANDLVRKNGVGVLQIYSYTEYQWPLILHRNMSGDVNILLYVIVSITANSSSRLELAMIGKIVVGVTCKTKSIMEVSSGKDPSTLVRDLK